MTTPAAVPEASAIPASPTAAPVIPAHSLLRPLGQGDVQITGGFWGEHQQINAAATLAHIGGRLESEGWLGNFDLAAHGGLPEGRRGREFSDSEVYKYLEALAWEIGRSGSADLERRLREVVARIGAAQDADGYLNTNFGRPGQEARWSHLRWGHELYCLGHLFQAAVARVRTRPDADDGLVEIARRAADLVCATFGPDGIDGICGHAEVEVGLAELGRALHEPRYTAQAALFVDRHGHGSLGDVEWGRSYFQDDIPVREATVLRGHAVRANYLASGAADVAADTGDVELMTALRGQWERTIARRTYLTGGQGSHHQDEAFGEDFELPNGRAYSETCAGVGSVMFAWRMLLADGHARYADLIERTLYNVVATSPAADGCSFFYANTLHQRVPGTVPDPTQTSPRASSSMRAPWFEVSCCPPNVARTLASLDAYIATATDDGIQLHQYAPARIRTTLASGAAVDLDVSTRYPADGVVRVTVGADARFTLSLRVPAWADSATDGAVGGVTRGATVRVLPAGGGAEEVPAAVGTVDVTHDFHAGDVVELVLPMAPRLTRADPRVDADRGSLAIERGPEVLALESVDLAGTGITHVDEAVLDATTAPVERDGRVWVRVLRRPTLTATDWPYTTAPEASVPETSGPEASDTGVVVPLVPYHSWGNRGPSTMRVWVATA